MPRVTELIGKSVITADTGDRLGRIDDLILDCDRAQIEAVFVGVDWRSWLGDGRVLPFSDVHALGRDAVVARGGVELLRMAEWRDAGRPMNLASMALKGKPVLTGDGHQLGTVRDAVVDPDTGRLDQIEIAARDAGHLTTHRSMLTVTPDVRIGNDVIVVPGPGSVEAPAADERGCAIPGDAERADGS